MPGLREDVDPGGLLEYSVVFTDRSLNHMSQTFQGVMNDISSTLKQVYGAKAVAVIPGGGTFAMEAVARQFASDENCLIVRNGFFSYRWSQILEMGGFANETRVLNARPVGEASPAPFAPAPLQEVVDEIESLRPGVVFAPHVETASGVLLPDDYLRAVADATHAVGGLLVLDCIASGALWIDMPACGVDVLLSAPQKGWSASPCAGLVMLGERGQEVAAAKTGSSFACDLGKWLQIMAAYEAGGHAYHATMPTDALSKFRDAMRDTAAFGFDDARGAQLALGQQVRELLTGHGFKSVAAPGFEAPGVVVSYTDDPEIQNGKRFLAQGLQVAAGVPLQCGEPDGFSTFRIGLFGLDKLQNIERTVNFLRDALTKLTN
ncbi:MAG: alanine--glyoxylate aminotransferase family protein [Pseudomonadales bacterium]